MQDVQSEQEFTVAVAGATGYAGSEILRILAMHPHFRVTCVTGNSSVGHSLGEYVAHIPQFASLVIKETTPQTLNGHDIVILALPHGESGKIATKLHDVKVVVDLGADHRLESKSDWDKFYGGDFYESWTYGLPELITGLNAQGSFSYQREELKNAHYIAGPGCNVTAVTLALQPAIAAHYVEPGITANLVVGYSGAGKNLSRMNLLAAEAFGSATPYSIAGTHRHIPEIKQNFAHNIGLGSESAHQFIVGFTPVLAPMARGILATVSAPLSTEALRMNDEDIRYAYKVAYDNEEFVEFLAPGQLPATGNVVGSNAAHIQVAVDREACLLYAFSAIDNLNRGTAGQAVQSLNIALGLPEDEGLTKIGVAP